MKKAVLFLTFNRMDSTRLVFDQIRAARPPRLYVSSDGARDDRLGEKEIVESVRNYIMDHIDWECELTTKFNEQNLGCGKALSGAITWFFEQEQDGIILEDDCIPEYSFFGYCEQMLDYYKDDKRVWCICGDNPLVSVDIPYSYFFAKIPHCWGWASWSDRWCNYRFDLADYDQKYIRNLSGNWAIRKYWRNILRKMKNHEIDTWDYQWTLAVNKYKGLAVIPKQNLVSNIGVNGVHYIDADQDHSLHKKTYTYDVQATKHNPLVEFDRRLVHRIFTESFPIIMPKDIRKYMYIHPLFLFRRAFWRMLKALYDTK